MRRRRAEGFAVPKDRGIRRRTACSGACAVARPTRMRRRSRNAFRASTSSFAEPALPRRLSLVADGDLSYGCEPHRTSRATAALTPSPERRDRLVHRPTRQMVLPRLPFGSPRLFKVPRSRLLNSLRGSSNLCA